MIIKAIICILIVVIIALICNAVEDIKRVNRSKMSFKEALDLTDIPVVTFVINTIKLNFLLDTGSSSSYINKSVIDTLKVEVTPSKEAVIGIEGSKVNLDCCQLILEYKGKQFESGFGVLDLDKAFTVVKEESGVQIHGILGSDFFQKYGYVLDFEELIAYVK